jgi:ActR/RegA family two-component response regulator
LIADSSAVDRARLAHELRTAADVRVILAPHIVDLPLTERPRELRLVLAPSPDALHTTLQHARDLYGPVKIIVIGNLPAMTAFAAARLGAEAYLPKPVSGQQILAVCRSRSLIPSAAPLLHSLARAEWEYLHSALTFCRGNRSEAARRLGIQRSVLQRKLSRPPPPR